MDQHISSLRISKCYIGHTCIVGKHGILVVDKAINGVVV